MDEDGWMRPMKLSLPGAAARKCRRPRFEEDCSDARLRTRVGEGDKGGSCPRRVELVIDGPAQRRRG